MSPSRRRVALSATAVALAFVALASSPIAMAQRAPLRVLSVPEADGAPATVSKALLLREREAGARGGEGRPVAVIVRLQDEAVASYRGGIAGLNATSPRALGLRKLDARSPDAQRYAAFLDARQQAFASGLRNAVPSARVTQRWQAALNGVAAVVPEGRISALAALPGVAAVYEDTLQRPTTETSPAFIAAPALWNQLGGVGSAGEGVIVGVLDTGAWPEHPSFADPDPSGKPYPSPPGPARACEFSGGANPGAPFACNNKLIGADRKMATYDALVGLLPTEFTSARDDDGHGTHTATTAGGNSNVPASIFGVPRGLISGIAPRAHVMAYKVCGDQGCFGSDSVAAVNQAIVDGVDVINFSISGGANPYSDAVSLAFLNAYNAGVFVAASAGNAGPGASTTDHREPWVATVAASTSNRQFENAVTLQAGSASLTLRGASVTAGVGPAAVVVPPAANRLCNQPFAAGSLAGAIVVCERGDNARVDKGFKALQAGAVGMILYNPALQGLATDNHFLPTIHLENAAGNALKAFLAANTGISATLGAGAAAPAQGDVIAAFSSRGGVGLSLGVAKPDITAPGVQILAGHTPAPATPLGGPQGELFQAIQGTSMSSPHVAGAAALLVDLQPGWTPGQVKSALMTTAFGTVYKEDGLTPATPFDTGSGRIDLGKAGNPGLLFDETGANYVALQSRLWEANYPSLYVPGFLGQVSVERTVRNTRNATRDWKLVVVQAPTDLKVTVPTTVNVPAGGSATFRVDLDGRNIPNGQTRHALVELRRPNEASLRFPITVVRGASAIPLSKSCSPLTFAQNATTECTLTLTNMTFTAANVSLIDTLNANQLQLVSGSVVNATETGNGVQWSGTLAAAEPAGIGIGPGTTPAGYLPLSLFGIPAVGGVGDDTVTNFNVPAFSYAGELYSRIGFSSNGYVVVGGSDGGADNSINNQNFPSATRPNNVIAPFWTDLNPAAAGAMRIGTLTDGVDTWIVLDWQAVREFSQPRLASFQIWIGVAGDAQPGEDVSIAYGPIGGDGDGGLLSVGAENRTGNRGGTVYFNGTGTLPAQGTQLRLTSSPPVAGGSRTISFSAKGKNAGPWSNCAQMTSSAYVGTQTACVGGTVTK